MGDLGNAEPMIKLLYTYGPFALLVFFLFAGEGKARKAMREATPEAKTETLVIYGLTWTAVFALLVVAIAAWYRLNFPKEVTLAGQFQGLQGSETMYVETTYPDAVLYLNKRYIGSSGRFTYHWRLVSQKPLPAGEPVQIALDSGQLGQPASVYVMKMRPDCYSRSVLIEYLRSTSSLKLTCGDGQAEELAGQPETRMARIERPVIVRGVVYAGSGADIRATLAALEANDPIIRRNARVELTSQGAAALPAVNQALSNPQASYRLRLGVIAALNQMRGVNMSALSRDAFSAIERSAADPEPVLSGEARRFLAVHPIPAEPARRAPASRK